MVTLFIIQPPSLISSSLPSEPTRLWRVGHRSGNKNQASAKANDSENPPVPAGGGERTGHPINDYYPAATGNLHIAQ